MERRRRATRNDEPDARRAPAAPAADAARPTAQAILALQASAGNQAVARTLARSGGAGAVERVAAAATGQLPHRSALEATFGTDLGGIRADAGSPDATLALAASQAHAAALPERVVFDRPDPGVDVVAHEVTHVLQQRNGGPPAPQRAEREAHAAASAAVRCEPVAVREGAAAGVPQFLGWQPGTTPPVIKHDHGFLDDGKGNIDPTKMRPPTAGDYASLAKWRAKLYAAQMLRGDLADGTRAYEHFLDGRGAPLTVNYEAFVANDASGTKILESAIEDVKDGARVKSNEWMAANPAKPTADHSFDITSDSIPVGPPGRYPYPETENWQKAIGAHVVWLKAHVDVHVDDATGQRTFKISMFLNMEDRYNFNPGQHDIATGAADAENGAFEVTGLGHEFMQYGSVTRKLDFTEPLTTPAGTPTPAAVEGAPRSTPGSYRHDREGGEV